MILDAETVVKGNVCTIMSRKCPPPAVIGYITVVWGLIN